MNEVVIPKPILEADHVNETWAQGNEIQKVITALTSEHESFYFFLLAAVINSLPNELVNDFMEQAETKPVNQLKAGWFMMLEVPVIIESSTGPVIVSFLGIYIRDSENPNEGNLHKSMAVLFNQEGTELVGFYEDLQAPPVLASDFANSEINFDPDQDAEGIDPAADLAAELSKDLDKPNLTNDD